MRITPVQGEAKAVLAARRLAYFGYVYAGEAPKIAVHQDLDGECGIAACWGDGMTNIHIAV